MRSELNSFDAVLMVKNKIEEFADNLECFDLARTNKKFRIRLLGMKVVIFNDENNTMLILNGIVDDILMSCVDNSYVHQKQTKLNTLIKSEAEVKYYDDYVKTIILKEWFVYTESELFNKLKGYDSQLKLLKQKSINQVINDFANNDLYSQRSMLILMLSRMDIDNFKYLAYLWYDLLSNYNNGQ